MGEFEAVGDVVTGGLYAGAVERPDGPIAADGHTQEANCLNCGAPLAGDYCSACGQRGHVHRTLRAFGHDLVHGVFHFEGKVWDTLPLLAWRPGELTRRYVAGERAKFVSPTALFLFSVFLMFAVVNATGSLTKMNTDQMRKELAQETRKSEITIKALERQRDAAARAGLPTAPFDSRIAEARTEAGLQDAIAKKGMIRGSAARASDDVPSWLQKPMRKAADNPELLLYKLRNNAYKYSWALIPISVPFLWLLFPFSRRFRLYDHTIFVTYSLSFMSLLLVAALLVGSVGLGAVAGFAMLIPPVHLYRQLKGAYGLTRAGALWRTVALIMFALLALSLFVTALFGFGLFD